MRIVFFINDLGGGGAERVVSTLANHLADVGQHDVSIVTHHHNIAYPLSDKVKVSALRTGRLLVGPGKILFLPLVAFELSRKLAEIEPDAVMSFLVRPNLALVLTRWFGRRGQITISERCATRKIYSKGLAARVMVALVSNLYPHADRIVAISEGVKASLESCGISGDQVRVIYNPQDLAEIRKRSALARRSRSGSEPFAIVMAGRLVEQKDYPTMLRALKKLLEWDLHCRLIVLGEGPLRQELTALSEKLGVSALVEWRGWVPNCYEVMASSDLFALSSIFEGFGNVLVEAMACGLPVVSTDCESGPSEILEGGKYGVLVPVGDSDELARAIKTMMTDAETYKKYRQLSLERAPRYDVSVIAKEYLDVLEASRGPTSGSIC